MKKLQFLSALLSILLFFISPFTIHGKSMIEPCSSADSCTSLLAYVLPYESMLSEIAYRFKVNITDVLAANSINPTTPSIANHIFQANSLIKIPISCTCVDGIRRSTSTTYTIRAADTFDSISEGYGGMVSGEQIRSTNGINAKNPLINGQTIVIPLPCTCFNNSNNGFPAVYMSYVVRLGESLESIAMEFSTTVVDLEAVNELGQPVVDPGDILSIPISACSSANLKWYNESLIVPNGSYALTANNCIKCLCEPQNLNLQCLPSGIVASCSHLQCKGSDLFIGESNVTHTQIGCNVTSCTYRGHNGGKIFRSLVNSTNVQCSPGNGSYIAMCPEPAPFYNVSIMVPSIALPPLSSPAAAPYAPTNGFKPRNKQDKGGFSDGELVRQVSWFGLLVLEIAITFLFVDLHFY